MNDHDLYLNIGHIIFRVIHNDLLYFVVIFALYFLLQLAALWWKERGPFSKLEE